MNIRKLLGDSMKIIKTVKVSRENGNSFITLYKVPGTESMKTTYAVESFDKRGRTIQEKTFRWINRIQDAEKMYHWVVTLSMNEAV